MSGFLLKFCIGNLKMPKSHSRPAGAYAWDTLDPTERKFLSEYGTSHGLTSFLFYHETADALGSGRIFIKNDELYSDDMVYLDEHLRPWEERRFPKNKNKTYDHLADRRTLSTVGWINGYRRLEDIWVLISKEIRRSHAILINGHLYASRVRYETKDGRRIR